MKTHLDWNVPLNHDKCGEEQGLIDNVLVNARGEIILKMFCPNCGDEFTIRRNMMEIAADAMIADRTFQALDRALPCESPQLLN